MGRQMCSQLELVKPQLEKSAIKAAETGTHNKRAMLRSFKEGRCLQRIGGTGNRWLSGKVVLVTGPVSAVIKLTNSQKHFDQIRKVATEIQFAQVQ